VVEPGVLLRVVAAVIMAGAEEECIQFANRSANPEDQVNL
jgi:hypothetical protein